MDVTLIQYRSYYKLLAVKIGSAIIIVAVVPLLIMAASSRHFFLGSYKQKVLEHLVSVIHNQQQKIYGFFDDRFDALKVIGLTTQFDQLNNETVLQDRLIALQQVMGTSLLGLAFWAPHGKQFAYAGFNGLPDNNELSLEMLRKTLEMGSFAGGLQIPTASSPYFIMGVKVDQPGETGVLFLTVSIETLNTLLDDPQWPKTGKSLLVGRDGEILAPRRAGDVLTATGCGKTAEKVFSLHGMSLREAEDGSTLCIQAEVKQSDWMLEFVADTDEVSGAFSQPRIFALSTLLLGIVGIVAVAIVVATRFSRYVSRVDQENQLINEQLVQTGKLAALGEMASGMAHEINNPVGIMVQEAQWIQALLSKAEGNPAGELNEIGASLNEIQAQGTRCRDIIMKLINFTRTDEPVVESLQLNDLVQEITGLCQQRAGRMKIEVRHVLDPELPMVSAAPSEVQQVLINLLNNGLDAMEQNGGVMEVRTTTTGRFVVVVIADTGPGIPQKNLGRIFDPFFSTKPEGKGTGLGLSICHVMMRRMKGDITVSSEEGKGTTFHLFFPVQER